MKIISNLFDSKMSCHSVLVELELAKYMNLIDNTFQTNGGIEGQRGSIKTASGLRIRKRLKEDIKQGAILPPLVVGLLLQENTYAQIPEFKSEQFETHLTQLEPDRISLIDGMQRTTAFKEVIDDLDSKKVIRVEFWVSKDIDSLIYRMLILNTGQVPWNIRRQIETIYKSMIYEIKNNSNFVKLMEIDDSQKRTKGGMYQADQVIELFLVYGARKEKLDIKEKLADEFTRLDFVEASESSLFTDRFYMLINYLAKIDKYFDKFVNSDHIKGKFYHGKDLFKSQPARVGFITAAARVIMGRPGKKLSEDSKNQNFKLLTTNLDTLIEKIRHKNINEIKEFLQFEILNQKLDVRTGRVGTFEREFFLASFEVFFEDIDTLDSMEVCWSAY